MESGLQSITHYFLLNWLKKRSKVSLISTQTVRRKIAICVANVLVSARDRQNKKLHADIPIKITFLWFVVTLGTFSIKILLY